MASAKAEELYKATLMKKEKFRKENRIREEIQENRKLLSQLEKNVRELNWNPQLCCIHINSIMKENASLVDSENGANNYAEYCIHPDAAFKNKSALWKSTVTADHPMFQKLYEKHKKLTPQSDLVLSSILQSKSGSRPSFAGLSSGGTKNSKSFSFSNSKSSVNQTVKGSGGSKTVFSSGNNKANSSTGQVGGSKPAASSSRWSSSSQKTSSLQDVVQFSDNESPDFDLCLEDVVMVEEEDEQLDNNRQPADRDKRFGLQEPKPMFGGKPKGQQIQSAGRNTFKLTSSNPSPNQASNFLDKIRGAVNPNVSGHRSDAGSGGGGYYSGGYNPGGGHRNNPGQNRNFKTNANSLGPGQNPGQNKAGPISSFKTAHEQLYIDQQNKKQRGPGQGHNARQQAGEITTASYGGGVRKCLGTRPGPAAGFKPPVKQDEQPQQGANQQPAAGPSTMNNGASNPENPEFQDPRYKNVDPKMIELIMNEIMDHGAPVQWDDIAGLHFQKKTVKEIVVLPMLRPDIFTGLRGPPKGLLLFGPPGTGKTLIGKCIACQSKSTFFSISASSLTSKWVGEGEKMVRALFAVAKVHQPSVIFIDEIDSLLSARSETEHESSRRMKTEFLVQLDGAGTDGEEKILIVGATNRPQELDEAARRRLVKRLLIPLPEKEARYQIIVNLLGKERNELSEKDICDIVDKSDGYSGADMANLCKEAAMGPIRSVDLSMIECMEADQVRPILKQDLLDALRQVKASVSDQDLQMYEEWNEKYGAGK